MSQNEETSSASTSRKTVRQVDGQTFYKVCRWIEKQPQPIRMTRSDAAKAFHADTGIDISTSTIANACKATGIVIQRSPSQVNLNSDPSHISKNRTRTLAIIVEQLHEILSERIGITLPKESRDVLRILINNRPLE